MTELMSAASTMLPDCCIACDLVALSMGVPDWLFALQGARQVKASPLGSSTLFVFIKPPSLDALESRLRGRGSEDDSSVRRRLETATDELRAAEDSGLVDITVVNDDVSTAYRELCEALSTHLGVPVEPQAQGDASGAERGGNAPDTTATIDGQVAGAGAAAADAGSSGLGVSGADGDAAVGSGDASEPNATEYLHTTVVAALKEALTALNDTRPADPMQFLIDELSRLKAQQPA